MICDDDPSEHISSVLPRFGYDPESFEYKSSSTMANDKRLQALPSALKSFIGRHCKIAVCVVDGDNRLGPVALKLLAAALSHPHLNGQSQEAFFYEGLL